jgi:hypothetical protein
MIADKDAAPMKNDLTVRDLLPDEVEPVRLFLENGWSGTVGLFGQRTRNALPSH